MQPTAQKNVIDARGYRVVALDDRNTDDAAMLKEMLGAPAEAQADPKRPGFYWIDGDAFPFYVHVRDDNQTVYLIAVEGGLRREALVEAEASC